MRPARWNH